MLNPHRCIIDSEGYYVDIVLLIGDGEVLGHEMKPGETLVEASPPANMAKPRWNKEGWEDVATAEKFEEWRRKRTERQGL